MTCICVSKVTIIVLDNGLSPGRHQAIIWANAGILLLGPLRTNFSEILIEIEAFSFRKMHLKMSSSKWRPFRLGLNVLNKNNDFQKCYTFKLYCTSVTNQQDHKKQIKATKFWNVYD